MVSWREYVAPFVDGDPVNAAYNNTRLQALVDRDDYLKNALDLAMSGRALVEFDVPIDSSAIVGTPVYVNDNGVYVPAQAAVLASGARVGQIDDQAYVVGIVITKTASQRGNVALAGIIDNIDFSAVDVDGVGDPGKYWLDSVTAGRIRNTRPSTAIFIGQLLANGSFIISRWNDASAADHIHLRFNLESAPAVTSPGALTPPPVGDPWDTSLVADSTKRGWLPANDPIFGGNAPAGAAFGYNIALDPGLASVYPPLPLLSYFAVLGRDVVDLTLMLLDANGIWWMTDEYSNVPWSVDYPSSGSSEILYLYLVTANADTYSVGVDSLQVDPNTVVPLEVTNTEGDQASTGALILSIPSLLTTGDTDRVTNLALKEVDGNTAHYGPVVVSIIPSTPGLTITGTLVDGKPTGEVAIALDAAAINLYVEPNLVRHGGTQQDYLNEFAYVSHPPSRDTSAIYHYRVPSVGVGVSADMRLQVDLFGLATGTLPDLVVEYRLIPAAGSPQALPSVWTALETLSGIAITSGQALTVESTGTIPVGAGYTVLARLSRAGSTDGYTSAVAIAKVVGILE